MGKKKEKKGLLGQPTLDTSIEGKFSLHELKLKGHWWTSSMTVEQTLTETQQHYDVQLTYDESPHTTRIAALKRDLEAGLFAEDKVAQKNAEKSIEKIKAQMEKERDLCPDIGFFATVLEVKYVDAGTRFTLQVPDKVIEPINKNRTRLNLYKAVLKPSRV